MIKDEEGIWWKGQTSELRAPTESCRIRTAISGCQVTNSLRGCGNPIEATNVGAIPLKVAPYTKFFPVAEPFGTSACFYIVKWYQIELQNILMS